MTKLSIKIFVGILCGVFLFCSLAIAGLIALRGLPGLANGRLVGPNRDPYQEAWTFDVQPGDKLVVKVSNVQLEVSGYDGNTVNATFEGTRSIRNGREPERIDAQRSDGQIIFEQTSPARISFSLFSEPPLEGTLRIQIPRDQMESIALSTFSGEQMLQDVQTGDVQLDCSSGKITVRNVQSQGEFTSKTYSGRQDLSNISSQETDLEASSGGIHAENLTCTSLDSKCYSGEIAISGGTIQDLGKLEVSSGNIDLQNITAGSLDMTTFSGDIRLDQSSVERVNASVSSGKFTASLTQYDEIRCESFSGSIVLTLPAGEGFTLAAEALSGSIENQFPAISANKSDHEVQATVGDGKHSIDVSTSSGSIRISPLP